MFEIDNKIHIDVFRRRKFIIKFDLCDNIKKLYPNYNIPNELTEDVIKSSAFNTHECKIPILNHELMMRQLEYDTHIKLRPEKIKHLYFIEKYPDIIFKTFIRNY